MDKKEKIVELNMSNKELTFQNEKPATELFIANSKLLKAEARIRNGNRLYSFISQIRKNIVHDKDEQTLFSDACSIAVNKGEFKMAWIGIGDTTERKIKLVASSAASEDDVSLLSDYTYINEGPIEKTLSGFDYVFIPDLEKESETPWNSHANEPGFKSSICLPIKKSGKTIGVFCLYSSETDFFDTEEINMLIDASNDISFAVTPVEDIKQKKIVQQKLEHSEARLKEAQALGRIGYWEVDLITHVNIWSDEFYNIFEINHEKVTPSLEIFFSLLHSEDVSHARDRITQTFQNNEAGSFNLRYIKKDKGIKHIYTEWKFEFDENKKPVRARGTLQDITEKKQAQEALCKSESNLHTIFENTSEGFILVDRNGIVKTFNTKAAQTIFLNTEQEIKIGSKTSDFLYPSRNESYERSFSKVFAGESMHYDCSYERKNGETKWFSFTINPVYNKLGAIEDVCIISADITERKEWAQKLQESETFNKGVLSSLSSQIALIDERGTVLTVNKAWDDFAKGNGITSLERVAIGSNYFDACERAVENGDIYAVQALVGIQSVFKKEKHFFEMEYPCHSPEQQRWFILSATNFGSDTQKVVISHQNITKRKVAENNLSDTSVELKKTLSELTKILDYSLDVICTITADGEFVNVSAASQQVWGYTPAELIGRKSMTLVYDKDVDITSQATEKIFRSNEVSIFENRYVHKSGRVVALVWSVNWDEKLQLMYCIAKDVTEKKRLKKAIESERDQFYQMLLNAPSAIGMLKGINHVFEMVNPLYLQLIGKKDVIGKTVAEVLPEVIEQGFVSILDNVYRSGESYTGTEVLVKLDKEGNGELTDAYLNFIYQAYRNETGDIDGVFFFVNDISKQIISKKEIEKSEKFFKGVIENSDDMITTIDSTGNTIYTSPAVGKKFGYSIKETLGLKILDTMHPDDIAIMDTFMAKLTTQPGISMPSPLIRERKNDGSYIWVEGTLTNFLETEGINAIVANFRDVTERINAELKIRESEFRYRQIVETAQEGIWLLDENNKTTFVNKKMCEILEYTEEEMMGKENFCFMDADGKEKARVAMERRKTGIAEKMEFNYISKKGKRVITEISVNPIFDEMKNFKGVLGMISDISERKKLEDLLEKSNRLARIGSWEIDVLKGTVFWSDITKEIREVEPDFIPDLSTGIGYFTEGINKTIISQRVQQCIDKGIPWDEELQFTTFKGNLKWVRTIGEAVFIEGKCNKIYGSFQDITESKIAAEKVIRSEAKLKAAQQIAQVGSWEVDMLTNEYGWSDEFYRIFGINEGVLPSLEAFISFIHPDDSVLAITTLENSFAIYADSSFNFRFIRENGETGYATSEWKFEFDTNQNPLYVHGILRDLTQQKKAEGERVKMIADIIQRNVNLEQFTFIISHNLRAPAANIIGCAELLQDETIAPLEQKELLQGLYKSVIILDTVIKDINNILQVKSDVNEKKEVIIFSTLINDIIKGTGSLIAKHRVSIISDFSEVYEIYSLKIYIYSIFYNLISNSIKYCRPNEPPIIEIKSKKENEKIILTFKDNGLGIDMKTQGTKIFGLYRRFHSHVEGKGIGLFMVKTQVESLGGKITIDSEPNKGTEFTIVFENQF